MKALHTITVMLATAAIVSACQKDLIRENVSETLQQEISLRAVTGVQTKSALSGTNFPESFDMYVSAYYNAPAEGGNVSGNYFKNKHYQKSSSSTYWEVAGSEKAYWPMDGTLDFLALACGGVKNASNGISPENLSWDSQNYSSGLSVNLDMAKGKDPASNPIVFDDVLYGSLKGAAKASGNPVIQFNHAYSAIVFKAKCSQPYDAVENIGITLKEIKVNDVKVAGTFSANYPAQQGASHEWTNLSKAASIIARAYNKSTTAQTYGIATESAMPQKNLTGEYTADSFGDAYILAPEQNRTSFTLTYVIHNGWNGSSPNDKELKYTYQPQAGEKWESGKKNVYQLFFNLQEIVITPNVIDWDEDNDDDMSTISIPSPGNCIIFSAPGTASVSFIDNGHNTQLEYSTDGAAWKNWDFHAISFGGVNKVYIRGRSYGGINTSIDASRPEDNAHFALTGSNISCNGDIMSLLYYDAYISSVPSNYCFAGLFTGCAGLIKAPELPSKSLTDGCYMMMFSGCTNLNAAPALPATELEVQCYAGMFKGCLSLTQAPALPAMTMKRSCYEEMFSGCINLYTAPALPASTMELFCYHEMFSGCTSLYETPDLPAEHLNYYCYDNMFLGCTNLSNAHTLPATNMVDYCYRGMFSGCTSLVTPPEMKGTTIAGFCYDSMFEGCTALAKIPALNVDMLEPGCYRQMFKGCTSLTSIPDLEATTISDGCYEAMFWQCSGIETAPAIKADVMARGCCFGMFADCTNLTSAPDLKASTLADQCYSKMFSGCTKLEQMPKIDATTLAESCCDYMFDGCESLVSIQEGFPDIQLAKGCYMYMFNNCKSLIDPPALPSTRLADSCYEGMFYDCEKLICMPELYAETLATRCYARMFDGCKSITSISPIHATTLAAGCYERMFSRCELLTTVPADLLPITTLEESCYNGMFENCSSLTSGPALPATTLAQGCYTAMFNGCESLTTAPALPAEALAESCYNSMFSRCAALETAPALPAQTLAESCYYSMFSECTSLTAGPDLPATALTKECYYKMFYKCSSLISLKCLAEVTSISNNTTSNNSTTAWLTGVHSGGTFTKPAASIWGDTIRNANLIPSSWTIVDIQ